MVNCGMASVLGLILVTLLLFMLTWSAQRSKESEVFEVFQVSQCELALGCSCFSFEPEMSGLLSAFRSISMLFCQMELQLVTMKPSSSLVPLCRSGSSYGVVQAMVPGLLQADSFRQGLVSATRNWALILFLILMILAITSFFLRENSLWLTQILVAGLTIFGAVFAVNFRYTPT